MKLVDFGVLGQRAKAGMMAILSFSPCEAVIRAEGSDGARNIRGARRQSLRRDVIWWDNRAGVIV